MRNNHQQREMLIYGHLHRWSEESIGSIITKNLLCVYESKDKFFTFGVMDSPVAKAKIVSEKTYAER